MTDERKQYESFEEVLEDAAIVALEIADIFKPQQSRQKKIYEGLFDGNRKNKELTLVRNCQMDPTQVEWFRDSIKALFEFYRGIGMDENLKAYFEQAGVKVKIETPDDFNQPIVGEAEKIQTPWYDEFPGENIPDSKSEACRTLLAKAIATQTDINELKLQIIDLGVQAEQFDVSEAAFKKALEIKLIEKLNGSVDEKLESIEATKAMLDKATELWR